MVDRRPRIPIHPEHVLEGCFLYLPTAAGTIYEDEVLACRQPKCRLATGSELCSMHKKAYGHLVPVIKVIKDGNGHHTDVEFLTLTASPPSDDLAPYSPAGFCESRAHYWLEEDFRFVKPTNIRLNYMFRLPLNRLFAIGRCPLSGDSLAYYYRLAEDSYERIRDKLGLPLPEGWYYAMTPARSQGPKRNIHRERPRIVPRIDEGPFSNHQVLTGMSLYNSWHKEPSPVRTTQDQSREEIAPDEYQLRIKSLGPETPIWPESPLSSSQPEHDNTAGDESQPPHISSADEEWTLVKRRNKRKSE